MSHPFLIVNILPKTYIADKIFTKLKEAFSGFYNMGKDFKE